MTAKNRVDFETVRQIGLALPGVEESTAYGSPALKLRGKLLACIPAHRSAEPGSLVVGAPGISYVTDHYMPYESVLVRLSQINRDALRDLLGVAYKFVSRKVTNRSRMRKPRLSS